VSSASLPQPRPQESLRARVPYVARCEIRLPGGVLPGLIYDLSPFGCFVHVEPPPQGEFDLVFALPDGGPPVVATVSVTWVRIHPPESAAAQPIGCGVRFVLVPPADRRRIETMVDAFHRAKSKLQGTEAPNSQAARVPLLAPCRLSGEFGVAVGRTCNLSIFGIYAAVEPIPPAGAPVQVELWLPRREAPLARRGIVTWRNAAPPTWERPFPPGCGVRFEDLSLREVRFLSSLVDEYLAQKGVPPA
jgi:hypothetical protein